MGAPKRSSEFYEFGPFLLDTSQRLLFRAGERTPLASKAFETLLVLLRNRGRIVERERFNEGSLAGYGGRGKQPEPEYFGFAKAAARRRGWETVYRDCA